MRIEGESIVGCSTVENLMPLLIKTDVKMLIRGRDIKEKKIVGQGKKEDINKLLKLKRAVMTALFCL
jgi:hypothetical protein